MVVKFWISISSVQSFNLTKMFKILAICFFALVAAVSAKPGIVAPVAYTSPLAYPAYTSPLAYASPYTSPYTYASAYPYVASPYYAGYSAYPYASPYYIRRR
uniref:Uncharacterized protein n=1 Tax=Megaselia scalaris TaxID=36166 RepID=T1GLD8_MEGSC